MVCKDRYDTSLQRRVEDIFQRCQASSHPKHQNYGGRGIRVKFKDKRELFLYLKSLHPAKEWEGYQIDRIDNNGHYEAGNIRRVSPRENILNRRNTVWLTYKGQKVAKHHVWHLVKTDYPDFDFGPAHVRNLLNKGVPPDELQNHKRVGSRRSTTLKIPDPDIVSLYRTG